MDVFQAVMSMSMTGYHFHLDTLPLKCDHATSLYKLTKQHNSTHAGKYRLPRHSIVCHMTACALVLNDAVEVSTDPKVVYVQRSKAFARKITALEVKSGFSKDHETQQMMDALFVFVFDIDPDVEASLGYPILDRLLLVFICPLRRVRGGQGWFLRGSGEVSVGLSSVSYHARVTARVSAPLLLAL